MAMDREKNRGRSDARFPVAWGTVIIVIFLLIGCGPKPTSPGAAETRGLQWKDMDISQRKQHMAKVVVPIAASIFQTWRPERYANVSCTLCHGKGVQNENFQMPTAHLPRLSGRLLLGPEFEKYPETTRLKLERLVPEMAAALQLKEFSLITRRGFGCYSCHLGPDGPMFGN